MDYRPDKSLIEDSSGNAFDGIMVDSNNPWFANLDEFSLEPDSDILTKSSESLVSLSSLLNLDCAEEINVGPRKIRQIPFKTNCKPDYFYLSREVPEDGSLSVDSVLVSKMFLVESEDIGNGNDTSRMVTYVVTMLAKYQYCQDFGFESISYLHHPYYSGVIIFSEPDSQYDYMSYYEGGELYQAEFVSRDAESNCYLSCLETLETRGGTYSVDEELRGEISPVYCTAPRPKPAYIPAVAGSVNGGIDGTNQAKSGGGGGGGGGTGGSSDSSLNERKEQEEEQKKQEENEEILKLEKKLNGIKVASGSDKNKNYLKEGYSSLSKNAVEFSSSGWGVLKDILEKVDLTKVDVNIYILESGNQNECNPIKGQNTGNLYGFKIKYIHDQLDNPRSLMEEILHIYQYESDWPNKWQKGDMEFEAKVFYSMMNKMSSDTDSEDNAMIRFYYNPNASTYKAAMEYYKEHFKGYQSDEYPITEGMDYTERIKHIR